MIRNLATLTDGLYIGDCRYDEGFRIREDNVSPCISTLTGGAITNIPILVEVDDLAKQRKVRSLTPKECFRLQGWSDEYFEKAQFVNSDTQLYKQAGNGVTVNVIYEIAKRMK